MSDDEKVKAEEAEAEKACEEKVKRGYFDSECRLEVFPGMVEYPGYFELPYPFLDRHTQVWWELAISPVKKLSEFDFAFYDGEWQAAIKLISDFGAWEIEGVPVGDLTTDGVPAIVKAWVMQEASLYISSFLPFRLRLKMSAIM
jgi:hypothetical protein